MGVLGIGRLLALFSRVGMFGVRFSLSVFFFFFFFRTDTPRAGAPFTIRDLCFWKGNFSGSRSTTWFSVSSQFYSGFSAFLHAFLQLSAFLPFCLPPRVERVMCTHTKRGGLDWTPRRGHPSNGHLQGQYNRVRYSV